MERYIFILLFFCFTYFFQVEIPSQILLKFVLPIIRPYLMETDQKMSALSDDALKLFAEILRKAPWNKYQQYLEQYFQLLNRSDKTKGAVR